MKVYALLSWYFERPDHLRRAVTSLKGFADVIVGVDGAYATFPEARAQSPVDQGWALSDAAVCSGLRKYLVTPTTPWASEVEKRAAMFEYGRDAGATPEDWFLIIDGDMELAAFTSEARELLAESECDIAEVRWHDIQIDGKQYSEARFRSMFRALPGLTVERAHYLYTVPCPDCDNQACSACKQTGRRFVWHTPDGHFVDERFVDLFDHVTLHHYNAQRDPERKARAADYYRNRDDRKLESAGDWHRRP